MRRVPSRAAVAVAVVALGLMLAGCMPEQGRAAPKEGASDVGDQVEVPRDRYVALGDSYTAAPLKPDNVRIRGCMRSRHNYPRLVADELGNTELVDVSCSGASTVSMFYTQGFDYGDDKRPPQLDAVTADTDLVTVSIGANDFRLFNSMIYECLDAAKADPDGAPCREQNTQDTRDRLKRTIERIAPRVSRVVEHIRDRAPGAQVLLVGYPKLLPRSGACPERLPLAIGDYDYARRINRRLAAAVRDAGKSAGADYVNLFRASKGHDICSDEPWIAGIRGVHRQAMGMHPYPDEQRAVADLILAKLERLEKRLLQRGMDHPTIDNG